METIYTSPSAVARPALRTGSAPSLSVHHLAAPRVHFHQPVMSWRDRLGVALSVICLVHCLSTPFVLGFLPMGVALGFWQHGFHQTFLLILPVVAVLAFVPGWKKHRDVRVWLWGGAGLTLVALGVVVAEIYGHAPAAHSHGVHAQGDRAAMVLNLSFLGELILTSIGGLLLIRAHWINRSRCAGCPDGHEAGHAYGHEAIR